MKWRMALLWTIAGVAFADEDAALRVLESCPARLDARVDIGLERIEKRCPDLLPALRNASWGNLLPKDMLERREEISADSLRELATLVRELQATPSAGAAPSLAPLAPVLAELGERGQQGATRWERFKRWLKDKLERRDQEENDKESWLERLGRDMQTSEGVSRALTYLGQGLLALLVLFILWSELRAAGVLGASGTDKSARMAEGEWRRRLQLADVLNAPLTERPGLLLKLLGEALTRSQRLPGAAGLSARALVGRAQLDSEEDRAELERVAAAAEAVRYAPRPPEPEQLEGAVSSARGLLQRLTGRGPGKGAR